MRILILQCYLSRFIESSFEIYVKVSNLVLQDVGQRMRVRDNAFNNFIIVD